MHICFKEWSQDWETMHCGFRISDLGGCKAIYFFYFIFEIPGSELKKPKPSKFGNRQY